MAIIINSTNVTATIVYELDPPRLLGHVHSIDRVVVEYVADSTDDDGRPYLDTTIKGWRLTSKMTVDKRQTGRENIYDIDRQEQHEYITEELGINYERDIRELLRTPVEA